MMMDSAQQPVITRGIAWVYPRLRLLPLFFLIFVTLWLRLVNLGYSDYQGDEILAMWRPAPGQSALSYIYSQKNGPIEYLVTYLVKLIDPNYSNEFLLRLPFALAGILAVYFFYKLVRLHFGPKIALYSTLLLSINGIFVGLMRIAQYQPFVILFSVLALYCFSLALQQPAWRTRGIYLGVFFWLAALLSHFDGIFIAPFAIYLLVRWYKQHEGLPPRVRLRDLAIPLALGALLLAAYFIPYILSVSAGIKNYWIERVAGGDNPDNRPLSSILNFKIYNPLLAVYLYPALGALSLLKVKKIFWVLIWLLVPWIIYEIVVIKPGTHIYTYLMPAVVIIAFGIEVLEEIAIKLLGNRWGARLMITWLVVLFGFLASVSHLILVDSTPEYPFEKRRILFWTIGGPTDDDKLWTYGFPYYRRWEDIGQYVTSTANNGYYATNENTSISKFYVPLSYYVEQAGYYIYIHNPQSFERQDTRAKTRYWRLHHDPVKVFEFNGKIVAEIYSMPPGSLEDIKKAGY